MPNETDVDRGIRTEPQGCSVDAAISEIAATQFGVLARRQLLELGVGPDAIQRRLAAGRLHTLHRGVYAVGHTALAPQARLTAGVLAAGPDAVVGHQSAAALWEIRKLTPGPIHLITPTERRQRPDLHLHHRLLLADEVTIRQGMPTTTPARTLFDLAAVLPQSQLERAIAEAAFLRLPIAPSLPLLLERHPGQRGNTNLKAALKNADLGNGIPKSELERRFLALVRKHRIPHPEVNHHVQIAGRDFERDCLWRDQRLNVELDGRQGHTTDHRFERDRADDRAMVAAGWRVIRVTWRQLTDESQTLVRDVVDLLGAG